MRLWLLQQRRARSVNLVAERRKRGKPSTTITKGNTGRCNHFDITSAKHLQRCFIHDTREKEANQRSETSNGTHEKPSKTQNVY